MRAAFLILSASLVPASACLADQMAIPEAYVAAGDGGRYYFKMRPATDTRVGGGGETYKVNADGSDTPVWSVSGWYSYSVYLSYDGENLVRLGEWSFAARPTEDRLGVAFYKRDRLIKQYSIKELVRDPSRAPRTVSFYHYLGRVDGVGGDLGTFRLTTCYGITYTFDIKTGAILSREARSAPKGPESARPDPRR